MDELTGILLGAILGLTLFLAIWTIPIGGQLTEIHSDVEALEVALVPEYHVRPANLTEHPEAAWQELMEGNARFIAGETVARDWAALRAAHIPGQWPFVSIVSCSDSRFAPEVIFDQGIGDVFIVRTAGNVVDGIALGSLEFSVNVLGTPLIVVLGHEGCGAVYATVDALKNVLELPPGFKPEQLGHVVTEITPAAEGAIATGKVGIVLREYATRVNVSKVAAEIIKDAFGVKEAIRARDVIVIGAKVMFSGRIIELFRVDAANVDQFMAGTGHLEVAAGKPDGCCR